MSMKRIITPEMALSRMAALCARAEICTGDASARLRRWGLSQAAREGIIGRLTEEGYISDSRFARAFVRDKYRFAGWGRRKIALALAAKRVGRAEVAEALESAIDEDEYRARLLAAVRSKARMLPAAMRGTFEGRRRLYAHALGRGYESPLINEVISSEGEAIWPDD